MNSKNGVMNGRLVFPRPLSDDSIVDIVRRLRRHSESPGIRSRAADVIEHQQAELARLRADREKSNSLLVAERERADDAEAERDQLRALLKEITALVRGECPSLLDEDSGGDARLSLAIDAALLSKAKA